MSEFQSATPTLPRLHFRAHTTRDFGVTCVHKGVGVECLREGRMEEGKQGEERGWREGGIKERTSRMYRVLTLIQTLPSHIELNTK